MAFKKFVFAKQTEKYLCSINTAKNMIAGFTTWSVEFILRMLLSTIYILSGAFKIFDISGFYNVLKHYRMLSEITCELLAYLLPPLQLALGILLFTKSYPAVVTSLIVITELIFVFFTMIALKKRGKVKNCGIFGTAVEIKLSWKIVVLNIALFSVAVYLLIRIMLGLNL